MIKVNNPVRKLKELKGVILLEYKGANTDNYERKCSRSATLKVILPESESSKDSLFQVRFQEYFEKELLLDFKTGLVRKMDGDAEIGTFKAQKIYLDRSSLVITGEYNHETIDQAYYDDNLTKFDVMFNVGDMKKGDLKLLVEKGLKADSNLASLLEYRS
jgi:hypothetical protein